MTDRWELPCTERKPLRDYIATDEELDDQPIVVSFWLAEKGAKIQDEAIECMTLPTSKRRYKSHAQLNRRFGPDHRWADKVFTFADKHNLTLLCERQPLRLISMEVPVRKVHELFGVELKIYKCTTGEKYRGRTGTISLSSKDFRSKNTPKKILGVFGLDNRPQARQFARLADGSDLGSDSNNGATEEAGTEDVAGAATFPPPAYGFPPTPPMLGQTTAGPPLLGGGQTIGVIGFGGTIQPGGLGTPGDSGQITLVQNQVITQLDSTFLSETKLDVSVILQCAPKVQVTVYAFDKTDSGWTRGLHEILSSDAPPNVLSISWGWPEQGSDDVADVQWTPASIAAMEDILAGLALRGVTTVVSSGDAGPNLTYPASSAFVLSCGGTIFPTEDGQESVWANPDLGQGTGAASGGGVSTLIKMPEWQKGAAIQLSGSGVPLQTNEMRCFPDIASGATFSSRAVASGKTVEGTSIAAPTWAALIALANQHLQAKFGTTAGSIHAELYRVGSQLQQSCTDVPTGTNSIRTGGRRPFYRAVKAGWDACTGWGSPRSTDFIVSLAAFASVNGSER